MKLDSTFYGLDNIAMGFFEKNFSIDCLTPESDTESGFKIKQTIWDNIYQRQMDIIRPWVRANASDLLVKVNAQLEKDVWEKYCSGNISKWEMSAISCYIHEHELVGVDGEPYKVEDFYNLNENPEVDRFIPIKGKMIPILKLHRIMGTVLDRNKAKKTVTLLTTEGVVTVKIYGGVFAQYDKQISERGADGKKHVIRKSEFSRGNKIIVIGVRDGTNEFRAKKYSKTPYHLVETIKEVVDGKLIIDNRNDGDLE
jgi:DNA polymerase-3 subunit alpha